MFRHLTRIATRTMNLTAEAALGRRNVSFGKAKLLGAAPEFKGEAVFPDFSTKEIKLSDYKGKYVVLFWYPKDFTFVCPTEIIAMSENSKAFKDLNCEVITASCDTAQSHADWMKQPRKEGGLGKLNVPILADPSKQISKDYGCFLEDKGFSTRATYIIDDKGNLRHASFNDPPTGRNPEEILRIVQALQYYDKNGELCPVNWKPGKDAINLSDAKSYFAKNAKD